MASPSARRASTRTSPAGCSRTNASASWACSGVATLPLLYLRRLAETDTDAAALLERIDRDVTALHSGEAHEEELVVAIAELRAHEVTRRTLDEAHRWAAEAVAALAPLPDGPVKKALTRFADSIVERSS